MQDSIASSIRGGLAAIQLCPDPNALGRPVATPEMIVTFSAQTPSGGPPDKSLSEQKYFGNCQNKQGSPYRAQAPHGASATGGLIYGNSEDASMKHLQHILVGIDFSRSSKAALREAIRWAQFDSASMTAIHAIERSTAELLGQALGLSETELRQHLLDRLKEFLVDADATAKWITPVVQIGHPFATIVNACQRLQADLLVLGAQGPGRQAGHVGIIAGKCVRKVPIDVLLVKEDSPGPFHQVLACVDFSETSAKAVEWAATAAQHDHAKLDCVHVNPSAAALAADFGVLAAGVLPLGNSDSENGREGELNRFVSPLVKTGDGVAVQNVVVEGVNVRDTIRDHIMDTQADLVVLGTRGKNDLKTLMMGTTAEKIVASAPCSILAVKPPKPPASIGA